MSVAQMGYPAPPDPQFPPQTVTSVNTLITALTSVVFSIEIPNGVLPNNAPTPFANTRPQGAGMMTIGAILTTGAANPPQEILITSNNGAGGNPAYNFYAYPTPFADGFPSDGLNYTFSATVPFINTSANLGAVILTATTVGATDIGVVDLQITCVNFGIEPPVQ